MPESVQPTVVLVHGAFADASGFAGLITAAAAAAALSAVALTPSASAHTGDVNGPHLLMLTNPGAVTSLIEQAAAATTGRG
jgi:hypothetical protein